MSRDQYFRHHAILPPTTLPIEVTLAAARTPAHVRHPRVTIPRPASALWAPSPMCMDVGSADRALAAYVVARADGRDLQPDPPAAAPAQEIHDPGDLREPFTFVRGFGYALNLSPVIAVMVLAMWLLL